LCARQHSTPSLRGQACDGLFSSGVEEDIGRRVHGYINRGLVLYSWTSSAFECCRHLSPATEASQLTPRCPVCLQVHDVDARHAEGRRWWEWRCSYTRGHAGARATARVGQTMGSRAASRERSPCELIGIMHAAQRRRVSMCLLASDVHVLVGQ
jgi:hypothetical protein